MLQQVERNCLLASTSWKIWLLTVCFTADSIASATGGVRSRLRVPNLWMVQNIMNIIRDKRLVCPINYQKFRSFLHESNELRNLRDRQDE